MTNSKVEATFHGKPTNHQWPENEDHLFDKWTTNTPQQGVVKATQSRRCVHPNCTHFETRTAP